MGILLVAAVAFALYDWGAGPAHLAPATAPTTTTARTQTKARSTPSASSTVPTTRTEREPMPTDEPSGWRRVFADDFNGSSLDQTRWRVYNGSPLGDPAGWFDPSHVSVSDGALVISGYRDSRHSGGWTTGGISSSRSFTQTYGKYLVRFRLDRGVGISHAILLWPTSDEAPPEVDFSEDNGSGRKSTLATVHYGSADKRLSRSFDVDLTQWHTAGLEWEPGQLRFSFDGNVWWTVRGSAVPKVPMALAIQTQTWPCQGTWGTCPDASTPRTVRLDVDWVVAYARATGD